MDTFKELLREKLKSILDVTYRIKTMGQDPTEAKKKLFTEILLQIEELNIRREILQEEFEIDLNSYEILFYKVINNLLKLHFNENQMTVIYTYLESRKDSVREDEEQPIQIKVETANESFFHDFESPEDVWAIIKKLEN